RTPRRYLRDDLRRARHRRRGSDVHTRRQDVPLPRQRNPHTPPARRARGVSATPHDNRDQAGSAESRRTDARPRRPRRPPPKYLRRQRAPATTRRSAQARARNPDQLFVPRIRRIHPGDGHARLRLSSAGRRHPNPAQLRVMATGHARECRLRASRRTRTSRLHGKRRIRNDRTARHERRRPGDRLPPTRLEPRPPPPRPALTGILRSADSALNDTKNDSAQNDTKNYSAQNDTKKDSAQNETKKDSAQNDTKKDSALNETKKDYPLNDTRNRVVYIDWSLRFLSLCHSRAKRRIPNSLSSAFPSCHSEPPRRKNPGLFSLTFLCVIQSRCGEESRRLSLRRLHSE